MRRPLIAGNWKMNGSRESVDYLMKSIRARAPEVTCAELAVFPPYVFLEKTDCILSDTSVSWGGQDLSAQKEGAFTGEISATMLLDYGCSYVIVGHSERRALGETDALIAAKFIAAIEAGLRPILCVGESKEQHEMGSSLQTVSAQLDTVLAAAAQHPKLSQALIAYEPIWAIGTGQYPQPEEIQSMHQLLRNQYYETVKGAKESLYVLYGGSVQTNNASDILSLPDVDGVLVGGASLDADQFIAVGLCA